MLTARRLGEVALTTHLVRPFSESFWSLASSDRSALLPPPSPTYAHKKRIPAGRVTVTVHSHPANTPAPRDLTILTCGRLVLVLGEGEGEGKNEEDAWGTGRPIGCWVTLDTANRKARDRRSTLEHPRLPLRSHRFQPLVVQWRKRGLDNAMDSFNYKL